MESFGAWAKRKRPDLYGEESEESINTSVRDALANPARHKALTRWVREDFGVEGPDEEILSDAARYATAAMADHGGRQQVIRNANMVLQQADDFGVAKEGIARTEADRKQGFPVSDRQDARKVELEQVAPPGSPLELPEMEDEELEVAAHLKANPTHKLLTVPISGARMIVDETGKGVATLRPGSGKSEQWNPDLIPRLTGEVSYAQTAMANMGRDMAEGVFGRDVSAGRERSLKNTAFGLRELGGDVGAATGQAAPGLATGIAQAQAWPTEKLAGAMAGVDRGEAAMFDWLARKTAPAPPTSSAPTGAGYTDAMSEVFSGLAEGNRAEEAKWRAHQKDVRDFRQWDVPDYAREEVGTEAGRQLGKSAGEVASLVAPTDVPFVGNVIKAAGKAGFKALPAGVKLAAQQRKESLVEGFAEHGGKLFLNRPYAAAHSGKARDVLDRGAGVARNDAIMAGEALSRDMDLATEALAKRKGWSPKQVEQYTQEAKAAFGDLDLRRSASPEAQDLIRLQQPFHRRVYNQSGLAKKGVAYNPLHDYYGQDPSRAARQMETYDARAVTQNLGGTPWSGKSWETDQAARSAPGLDVLPDDVFSASKLRQARPREEKAEMVRTAMLSSESGKQWWNKRIMSNRAERLANEAKKSVMAANPNQAFGQSLTRQLNHVSDVQRAAADEMLAGLPEIAKVDKRFTGLGDYLKGGTYQRRAADAKPGVAYSRNVHGDIRIKDGAPVRVQEDALEQALKEDGMVLIQVRDQKPLSAKFLAAGEDLGNTHMNLPAEFNRGWHGKVVPRTWAKAMMESTTLSNNPNSRRARQLAQDIDAMVGLSQQKRLPIVGNMGQDFRNRWNEVWRVLAEERLNKDMMRVTQQLSHAPIGRAAGWTVRVGGRDIDAGLLRTELRRQGIGRSKQTEEAARALYEKQDSGALLDAAGVGGRANLGNAINTVHKAAMKPGEASSAASDTFFRKLLFDEKVLGAQGLHPSLDAAEGIKMWAALSKMKRGQSIESAARDTKTLLIDFTDKSAAQELLGIGIPYVKYYTGAVRGAFRTALANPRQYSRAADMARLIENADKSIEGYGSFDPRDKNIAERLGMYPTVKLGKGRASIRTETPAAEVGTMVDAAMGTKDGREDIGAGRYLAPWVGQLYATATGRDVATGRSLYNLSREEQGKADPGIYDQWAFYEEADKNLGEGVFLGKNPKAQLLWSMLKSAPLVGGRIMSPQADAVLRAGFGMGSGPSSRTVQGSTDAVRRAAISAVTGVRMPASDPQQERTQRTRALAGKGNTTVQELKAKRLKAGRPATGERQ